MDPMRRKLCLYVFLVGLTGLFIAGFSIFVRPNVTEDYEFVLHIFYTGLYVGLYHIIVDFLSFISLLGSTIVFMVICPLARVCCNSLLEQQYIFLTEQERQDAILREQQQA